MKSEGKVKGNGQDRFSSNIYLVGFVREKKCRRENSHIKEHFIELKNTMSSDLKVPLCTN